MQMKMQMKMKVKPIDQSSVHSIFTTLHTRIQELPENFHGFVQSECKWPAYLLDFYLKHPEHCPPEDLKIILKIARHLVEDLQALVTNSQKTYSRLKNNIPT
jgi:hypothetical protein